MRITTQCDVIKTRLSETQCNGGSANPKADPRQSETQRNGGSSNIRRPRKKLAYQSVIFLTQILGGGIPVPLPHPFCMKPCQCSSVHIYTSALMRDSTSTRVRAGTYVHQKVAVLLQDLFDITIGAQDMVAPPLRMHSNHTIPVMQ